MGLFYYSGGVEQPLHYPLAQLVTIKQNRFDQAVKLLEQKKDALEKARHILKEATAARDEVAAHKRDKLEQMRNEMDQGTTTDKIEQMRRYLKVVDEKLAVQEKRVAEQQQKVKTAEQQVEAATQEMYQRKKDLEKLEMHRKEWEKEVGYWIERKEGLETDEQGSNIYTVRKREAEMRKKRDEQH
jgi:flagellar biosynthesis chaperone FliJ